MTTRSPLPATLGDWPSNPARARDELFRHLTGVGADEARALLLGPGSSEERAAATARGVADRLAELLGLRKRDAARLMGVSESTISRRAGVGLDVLDRMLALSGVFADVAAVLGPEGARDWLTAPNAALDGGAPYQLMSTRAGERRVTDVIEALLNGAYL